MRTVFLLGSGISIDAEMPCVKSITQQVVSGDGVFLHSAKVFVIDATNPNYTLLRPPVMPVLDLIGDIRALATSYFGREPTYEEISQIARQLDNALSGEYESAAVMPLVSELVQRDYAQQDHDRLREITGLTHKYITDIVRTMLDKPPQRLDHLDALIEASATLGEVDLVTLNHDLVLEAALDARAVPYSDGFDRSGEDVRLWADEWHDHVRLLKLHGSLDWWGYQMADEPWRGWVTARHKGDDAIHPRRSGILDYPHDLRPVFLTGTFDKILAYETWIFPDQHLRFQEGLRQANRVISIGYGFGDKAINTRVSAWLARARENKLIVCHGNPDQLRADARGAIRRRWDEWRAGDKLAVLPVWVAGLTYDDMCRALE
jgi:SIR2-like protein